MVQARFIFKIVNNTGNAYYSYNWSGYILRDSTTVAQNGGLFSIGPYETKVVWDTTLDLPSGTYTMKICINVGGWKCNTKTITI